MIRTHIYDFADHPLSHSGTRPIFAEDDSIELLSLLTILRFSRTFKEPTSASSLFLFYHSINELYLISNVLNSNKHFINLKDIFLSL